MKIAKWIKLVLAKRKLRKEMQLRERCVKYAGNKGPFHAAMIYRFIVKGTYIDIDHATQEKKELVYPNLEGVIHQD